MDRFEGKVDTPGDGWELIRRDLGYDDAGNPDKTTNPTLILYNRYSSVLRVFTAVGDLQNGYQLAEIKLYFGATQQYKAGTLNRLSALGVALEDTEPNNNPEFVAVARYLNGRSKWFVADFPMDYDPCVCQFNSGLQIDVNLISQADVRLIGKTTGMLATASSGTSSTGADFDRGIPFIRKANGVLGAGGKSYDNIDKFSTKMSSLFPGKASALTLFQNASKTGDFLKTGLKGLPYVGAAMSMLDYFMGGGKDAGAGPVTMQPMTIEMSTTTTRTITTNNWATGVTFYNPGNRLSSSIPSRKPFYNEAMGVFSLLKKPVVETRMTGVRNADGSRIITRDYRLAQNLQYVINPASGLEVQDFQVALVAEGTGGLPDGAFYNPEGNIVQPDGTLTDAYRIDYVDAACVKNSTFRLQTLFGSNDPSREFQYVGMSLKIMVNLRRINGTGQNVLYVSRYPVTLSTVTSFASLPVAACGVLPQASHTAIDAVCQGTKYKQAIVLTRPGIKGDAALMSNASKKGIDLQVFPNPATGVVRLSYRVAQPGRVRLTLSDALGRVVQTVVDQAQVPSGAFETKVNLAGLRAGVYYCTLQTGSQHLVERIAVTE